MKRYLIIAAVVLVAGSWGGNIWFYQRSQLPEPVFFKHYIEVENSPGYSFELNYLENKSAKVKINSITIPELPNTRIMPIMEQYRYRHQNQGVMRVEIMDYDLLQPEFPEQGPLVINRVQVQFDDYSTKEMDIGEIRVYPNDLKIVENFIQTRSTGNSTERTGYEKIEFLKSAEINGISSAYLDQLSDRLTVILDAKNLGNLEHQEIRFGSDTTFDGVPLSLVPFPLSFVAGESATLAYKMVLPPDAEPADKSDVYRLLLRIETSTKTGTKAMVPMFLEFDPDLSERDVAEFVQARRSGE